MTLCFRAATLGLTLLALGSPALAETATKEKVVAAIPKLEQLARDAIAKGQVPGLAIAIVYKDEVVYLGGFGVRESGQARQGRCRHRVPARLVLEADVSDRRGGAGQRRCRRLGLAASPISIPPSSCTMPIRPSRSRSPTCSITGAACPAMPATTSRMLGFDRATILSRLHLLKPTSSFRAGYAYSNFGLTEGAVAAAKPTGKSWEDVCEEKLYKPLGMNSTSSRHADFLSHENRAELHVPIDGKWTALVKRDPDPQAPAGGVSSNVRDLAQWMRLELGNGKYNGAQLIKEEALAPTHQPLFDRGKNPVTGSHTFYGRGWNIDFGRYGTVWGHAGAFSQGARTLGEPAAVGAARHRGARQRLSDRRAEGLADSFFDLVFAGAPKQDYVTQWNAVFDSLFGPAIEAAKKVYATKPATPSPALPLSAYAGTYANDYLGDAVVAEEDGGLVLKLGPDGAKSRPLTHFDRDLFIYYPTAEMPDMPFAVTFAIGPDQKASQVTIDDLNDDGQGVLARVK